jgi:hypothetical protein
MKHRNFWTTFGLLLVAGCAGAPPQNAAPPATAPPPAVAIAAGADPAAAPARLPPVEISAETIATARRLGYDTKVSGRKIIFCERAAPTGSHLAQVTCIDQAHFDQIVRARQRQEDEAQDRLEEQRRIRNCSPTTPC